ncbi:MAG: GNAT family N-acetyltransferase [Planctomycetaceae bacterium]
MNLRPENLVAGTSVHNPDPFPSPPIRLRRTTKDDLATLYEMQLDPESNAMAVTNPRSAEAFATHWDKVLQDSSTMPMVILSSEQIVGLVSSFYAEQRNSIGYWIHRDFWGRGIASQALRLLLQEVTVRPLYAQAATSNKASLRVLQKCGFQIDAVRLEPACDRYPECEVAHLVLV